jgi:hypothetical protein
VDLELMAALIEIQRLRDLCQTPPAPEGQREAVIAAVTEALGNAYDCQRVWEAWGIGTMGEDDFALVAEDSDRVAEIADAAIDAMRPATPPAAPAALAQPEGEGPGEQEIDAFIHQWWEAFGKGYLPNSSDKALVAAALARWGRPATPPAPEAIAAVGNCARIELVVALHALCSQFEHETAAFTGDDLKAVLGHVNHARKISAKHNRNGPGCAPPAPEVGLGEGSTMAEEALVSLERIQHGDVSHGSDDFDFIANALGQLRRAATLLQRPSAPAPAGVAPISHAERLRIMKRGITAGYNLGHHHTVEGGWGDPDEVAADYAQEMLEDLGDAPAPAAVPVAVSERLPTTEAGDFDRRGRCWWGHPGGEQFVPSWRLCERPDASHFTQWRPHHAIPLPQAGEGQS